MCDGALNNDQTTDESSEMNAEKADVSGPSSPESNDNESVRSSNKRAHEPEWEAEPDLYGIRRSGRARTQTAPFQIETEQKVPKFDIPKVKSRRSKSSEDDSGSAYEESSSDGEFLSRHARKEKQARKKSKKHKSKSKERKKDRSSSKHKKSKKHKRSHDRKKKHSESSEDDDGESSDDRRTSKRQATKVKSYKEDTYEEELTDTDDESSNQKPRSVDYENTDGIDRILDFRIDNVGRTGHLTTIYSTEQPSVNDETEEQFFIKWQCWSHFHNTWESITSLELQKVRGMKKLENYIKRRREYDEWCETAEPESKEIARYQLDMQRTLNEEYTKAERIVDKRKDKSGQLEYYVKWCGLPYVECTWEAADLMERYFMTEILNYEERQSSKKLPMSAPPSQRPKFQQFDDQPSYLGGSDSNLVLRDYQITGINWLVSSWCSGRSCILADEMGLGKTIQTICFLSYLFNQHKIYGPFLVVVPLSTMAAWLREFELWAKEINVIPYIGDMKSREIIRDYEWVHKNRRMKFNAIVTTYELLMKDKGYLHNMQWAALVVDEAHRLKNDDSLLYRSLIEFSTQHRLLITGTPLQNSLRELWALMHFIEPVKFDNWFEFEERNQPSRGGVDGYSRLHKTIKPYMLRRLKKEVEKSLPQKVEQILRVDMSKLQKQYYKWILTRNYEALNKGLKGSTNSLLNIIVDLKKCCNHPWLIRPLDPLNEPSDSEKLQQIIKGGGKLWLLDKLLVRLYETNHRVLIFSQMVMMLDILAEYLTLRHFSFQRLDGSITGDQRKQAIDSFNSEHSQDFCFLLSTRAGGLGVNLATADTVIIFDSDWNPQNDIQAQSRAHRIGQTKQVNIYRLVTKFSVEEDIIERAKKKMVLDHLVIQRMDTSGRTVINEKSESKHPFNKEELNSILKFGAAELFKEADGEEEDFTDDFDIDDFLQKAETREESDQPQTVGEELLAGFKVANFNYEDEEEDVEPESNENDKQEWDEIIPTAAREKVEQEEAAKAESEMFLPPRQRTRTKAFQINFSTTARDHSSSSESASDEETLGAISATSTRSGAKAPSKKLKQEFTNWSANEVRNFVKSFKKFPNAENRLQEVAEDADLHEKSMTDMQAFWQRMKEYCELAVSEANKENAGVKTSKHASFVIRRVSVNATQLLKSQEEFGALVKTISILDSPYNYVLKLPKKRLPNWDVIWEAENDTNLIIGVYLYGSGNWDAIKNDDRLQLQEKLMLESEQKPQTRHLASRVEYLLRLLDLEVNPNKHERNLKSPDKAKDEKERERRAKKERKENLKREKKEREAAESAAKKRKIFKSREEIEDDSSSSDDDDGSEEGEVKVKSTKPLANPSLTSPLKLMWIPTQESDEHKSGNMSVSTDLKAHSLQSSHSTSQAKLNALNAITVAVQELDIKSNIFKACKEDMRSVKKHLQKLMQSTASEDSKKTSQDEMASVCRKSLVKVGDRVLEVLQEKDQEKLKEVKSNLWNFVAQFSKLNAETLHSIYVKSAKKKQRDHEVSKAQVKQEKKPSTERDAPSPDSEATKILKKQKDSIPEKITRAPIFSRMNRASSPPGMHEPRKRIFDHPAKPFPARSGEHRADGRDQVESRMHTSGTSTSTEHGRGSSGRDDDRGWSRERGSYSKKWESQREEQRPSTASFDRWKYPQQRHETPTQNSVSSYRDPRMSRLDSQRGATNGDNHLGSIGQNPYRNGRESYRDHQSNLHEPSSRSIADSQHHSNSRSMYDSVHNSASFDFDMPNLHLQSSAVPNPRSELSSHGAIPIELERPSSETLNNNEGMDFDLSWKNDGTSNSWSQ